MQTKVKGSPILPPGGPEVLLLKLKSQEEASMESNDLLGSHALNYLPAPASSFMQAQDVA